MPSCLCRRSNRSRHQPSWTQLNESGTDPSSSRPPARVAGRRSRRRPQALEDQAIDSQVGARVVNAKVWSVSGGETWGYARESARCCHWWCRAGLAHGSMACFCMHLLCGLL